MANPHRLVAAALSAYEWNDEFIKCQPRAYLWQNDAWVTLAPKSPDSLDAQRTPPATVDELINKFLNVVGDADTAHRSSAYQSLELKAFCAPGSLDVIERGTDESVRTAHALLDDRPSMGQQSYQVDEAEERRPYKGCLTTTQLFQELKKKRYQSDGEPDAGRRLLYVTNPDSWVLLALVLTVSRHQASFLVEFFYKYISNKTSLGIRVPPSSPPLFALEFHLHFYVWQEDGAVNDDSRRKRNGKTVRRSLQLRHLSIEEPFTAVVHEAQISCLVTGLDHHSWCAYLFVDTYYQGKNSFESVEHYDVLRNDRYQPDPLTVGNSDANKPIWTPREYFLTVFECRLKQMKHATQNLVSHLLLKLEPYVQDRLNLPPLLETDTNVPFDRKKQVQQMLNEASRLLRQTIHSIGHVIEVWDRFSERDIAYLSDILRPKGGPDEASPLRMIALLGDHINDLRDLRLRAEEQQELCAGLARELEMQLVMEDSNITSQQHATGEFVKTLTIVGLIFLPFTSTTAFFSMQSGVLPDAAYKWYWFLACWAFLTVLVLLLSVLHKGSPFRPRSWRSQQQPDRHRLNQSRNRNLGATSTYVPGSYRDSVTAEDGEYSDDIELVPIQTV